MSELTPLRELIESIDIDALVDELDAGWGLFDNLRAKLTVATATFEAEGRHAFAGALSMRSYLSTHTPLGPESGWVAVLARKLRSLPATEQAWLDGTLTGGQVRIISDHVRTDRVELFAEHEHELVPTLSGLSVKNTIMAMDHWHKTAENLIDKPPREPKGIRLTPITGDNTWKIDGTLSERDSKLVNDMINLLRQPPPTRRHLHQHATQRFRVG